MNVTGLLPDGVQAADQIDSHMEELYKCVDDISKSTPGDCDWAFDMYNLPPLPTSDGCRGSGGGDDGGEGDEGGIRGDEKGQPDGTGGVGLGDGVGGASDEARVGAWGGASSESPRVAGAAPTPPAGPHLRVETGNFIACAMPTNSSMSVMVGKVLDVRAGEEGNKMLLRWRILTCHGECQRPTIEIWQRGVDGGVYPRWRNACTFNFN